jgi:F-type H+-transporting ATPase subunit epsilon
VLTPERPVLDQEVVSIIAPGSVGYLGVLAHHAPLITSLVPGKLTVRDPDGKIEIYAVCGGFLEVADNKATILADALELPAEIDVERAERARKRAEERLAGIKSNIDAARAQVALERAKNRLRIAKER